MRQVSLQAWRLVKGATEAGGERSVTLDGGGVGGSCEGENDLLRPLREVRGQGEAS